MGMEKAGERTDRLTPPSNTEEMMSVMIPWFPDGEAEEDDGEAAERVGGSVSSSALTSSDPERLRLIGAGMMAMGLTE